MSFGLSQYHSQQVQSASPARIIVQFYDGALRFIKPNGKAIDSVLPGCTQPLGDWRCLPAGTEVSRWKGERMDYDLALEVLMQQAKRAKNVPAGTSIP